MHALLAIEPILALMLLAEIRHRANDMNVFCHVRLRLLPLLVHTCFLSAQMRPVASSPACIKTAKWIPKMQYLDYTLKTPARNMAYIIGTH